MLNTFNGHLNLTFPSDTRELSRVPVADRLVERVEGFAGWRRRERNPNVEEGLNDRSVTKVRPISHED
jgi:hypothetical protein